MQYGNFNVIYQTEKINIRLSKFLCSSDFVSCFESIIGGIFYLPTGLYLVG